MPYGEVEAQKAQAVAARTYALSGLGKRAADGYDLLPTTSDQVYGGYAAEHPVSTQAVRETEGVVATYEGKLIEAQLDFALLRTAAARGRGALAAQLPRSTPRSSPPCARTPAW